MAALPPPNGDEQRHSRSRYAGTGSCSCATDAATRPHLRAASLNTEATGHLSATAKTNPSSSSIGLDFGLDLNALHDSSSGSSSKSPLEPETSTCVEPDHRELIRSVSVVLHRRIRDNEDAESKLLLPLFCEDTHTEPVPEPEYKVSMPMIPTQTLGFPTLFTLTELPPPPVVPRVYDVPSIPTMCTFIENIWHRARLTPQSVVICLVYVDRLEARSEGVLLHARSWRPIVFSSLLLASKVWHDVSYWNSDFSSICPMFTLRNINRMELAYLKLLEYNTIISSSRYAQYYFSLRHALREARRPSPHRPRQLPPACPSRPTVRLAHATGLASPHPHSHPWTSRLPSACSLPPTLSTTFLLFHYPGLRPPRSAPQNP